IATLQQPIPQAAPGQTAPGQNAGAATRVPVQTVDNHKAATLGLVFGILSIVCFWSAVFCIIFAVLGFSQCRMGNGSSKAGQAKAGKICCVVGLSIMGVYYVLYFGLTILSAMLSLS
ncbi:MAG: hypothetical protein K2O57_04745, partial [Acetatifactor sp.]|nr:hypothetical protein [Acetatifactor sp.]